jgi:hypothetical protein
MDDLGINKNDKLAKLLKKQQREIPSANFTSDVMSRLGLATSYNYQYEPLISIKGWLFISFIILLMVLSVFSGSTTSLSANSNSLEGISNNAFNIIHSVTGSKAVLLLSIAAVCAFILISAESFYRNIKLRIS